MRASFRGAAVSLTTAAVAALAGAVPAAADTNQVEQRPLMLCNIVLLSPGAQVGDGCQALQLSEQGIVKQGSVSSGLIDYVGVRPAGL
ncbi:hypothetical protein [Streptomyces sp. PR69]|uniref:hypothetical protein n=1 Tax=Streptomyces sp. PR69 TaxID=2984950 RepID=UPI002264156D|nr:hypothetical protein [Streptomyces sp. PR69]